MMRNVACVTDVEALLDGVELVIFDLDDTLYPEKAYVKSGYQKIAQAFPFVADMEQKLWSAFLQGKKAIDEVLTAEKLYSQENLQKCIAIYREQEPDIRLYDGVLDMLVRLRESGKKLAMITDGRPQGQRRKIRALGLEELFDEIIITDELGGVEYRKPNKIAFTLVAQRLGVAYANAVYVGDNLNKDFIAPDKLGMQSILVKNTDGLYYKG